MLLPQDSPAVMPDSIPAAAAEVDMLKNMSMEDFLTRIVNGLVSFAINLALAVAVFYIGKYIIRKIYTFVGAMMLRRKVDTSILTFTLSMIKIVLYFILIVTVIGILGIETSSFIALFASAGVAIGMALSGTLQNFAGGVLILMLKPYRIGDYIEAQGYAGTVREIQIFHTIICTPDNKSIIIPNGGLSTGSVNNYSKEDYRRIDWVVSISYGDDVDVARAEILRIVSQDPRVVKGTIEDDRLARTGVATPPSADKALARALNQRANRAPAVVVKELGSSSVDLRLTAWAQTGEYWNVFYDINERIYKELPSAGINFPFPHMDIHISGDKEAL